MTIAFQSINPRHERRLRLLFTASLAAGAFTDLTHYAVASADGTQVSPNVIAAIAIPGTVNAVDILVDADIVEGAIYSVSANGVPALDSSVTPAPSTLAMNAADSLATVNAEVPRSDVDALVYGEDLAFTGQDFIEGPDGDLGTIAGPLNAIGALDRCMLSDGLAWDGTYGAKPDDLVNGPPRATILKGRVVQQALRDDRVAGVQVDILTDPSKPADTYLATNVQLIGSTGARALKPIYSSTS